MLLRRSQLSISLSTLTTLLRNHEFHKLCNFHGVCGHAGCKEVITTALKLGAVAPIHGAAHTPSTRPPLSAQLLRQLNATGVRFLRDRGSECAVKVCCVYKGEGALLACLCPAQSNAHKEHQVQGGSCTTALSCCSAAQSLETL